MRKELLKIGIVLALLLGVLLGCSPTEKISENNNASKTGQEEIKDNDEEEQEKQYIGIKELDDLLLAQPLVVVDTEYVVQDTEYKVLFPDMLQAVLQNNSSDDIKNAVVAFVAWDENNLPVKIEGQFDISDSGYIKKVSYDDINLVPGGMFGENSGFSLSENCHISTFKAVAVSYETFDGKSWRNPHYETFCDMYDGKKYADDLKVIMH